MMETRWPHPEAMMFDLDGTLFKTETNLVPAYHRTFEQLREEGLFIGPTPPDTRILGTLGMLLEHIWENVIPDCPKTVHARANELLLNYQLEGLQQGIGELYPEVEETLRFLHGQGIRLFAASNGEEGYVKGVIHYKGLAPLFSGIYSAGEYKTRSKVDLVAMLLERHRVTSAWMVGDRSSDVEAGRKNGCVTIGCDYAGFRKPGELDGADTVIHRFSDLMDLLK